MTHFIGVLGMIIGSIMIGFSLSNPLLGVGVFAVCWGVTITLTANLATVGTVILNRIDNNS